MSKYQILNGKNKKTLKEHLVKEGQFLLPLVEMIERTEKALDEVIEEAGRATIEAILELSARSVAGEKHPGKKGSEIRWHGSQDGYHQAQQSRKFKMIALGAGIDFPILSGWCLRQEILEVCPMRSWTSVG